MSTAYWHPFANMARTTAKRVVLTKGEGTTLIDVEGRRYFDATAALWYCAVGYGRRQIAEAIRDQAARLPACSSFDVLVSDRSLELADRLAAMAPVDDARVFLTSGGSDGVDTAAKLVRRYFTLTGKPERRTILVRRHAYHGTHAFGTSLAGIALNREGYGPLVEDVGVVDAFDPSAVAAEIDARPSESVAAVFVEPMIGAGGVFPPPDDYLRQVGEICRQRGVLLVADEVICGFGRTGARFGCDRYGVRPDLLILAKILTSGYQPLGAVVVDGRLAKPFWSDGGVMWRHGYTYSGHATACAAALANLDILEGEGLIERAAWLGELLPERLAPLADLDVVAEIRTLGLTAAVQLDLERLTRAGTTVDEVVDACRARGVLTRGLASGALQFSPAFIVEPDEIDRFVEAVASALASVSLASSAA